MKLAFSSNAYMNYSIEETIRRIAAIGFTGIEVLADVPHAWPAGLLPERRRSILYALAEHQLQVSNVNGFMMNAVADPRQPYWHPSWIEPCRHYRAIRREHTIRALRLAAELGASNLQTEPGGPLEPGDSWARAAGVFYDELMPCVEVAEELQVGLLIEPEPGLLIERFDQYLEFVQRIESPAVGLNFDIGHAYCVGEDPQDWVARMAPHTRHYHCEDIAATRVHQHLVPGDGAIDFRATLSAIAATGYEGFLTVELYPYIQDPDLAAVRAFDYLSCLAAELGIELEAGARTSRDDGQADRDHPSRLSDEH
ncbi:MAG TPA: sugar phosphate isomerase/epimerase family protein [Pirellulales bacterium]